jgi:hypothetical protein
MKSRPREMIGDELPTPRNGNFQRMPSPSLNCTGIVVPDATPVPLGPRKRVQSAAAAVVTTTKSPAMTMVARRGRGMVGDLLAGRVKERSGDYRRTATMGKRSGERGRVSAPRTFNCH